MLHSFYSFDYVIRLPISKITRLLEKAAEKKQLEKAWELYVVRYQWMNKENYITFEEFYNPEKQVTENKSEAEILAEVKEILDGFRG